MPHFGSNDFCRVLYFDFAEEIFDKKHCCNKMQQAVNYRCYEHHILECPEHLIYYSYRFDEYGLIIFDSGGSCVLIDYCPWCGAKLPESKRDLWVDTLENLGFDNPCFQDIPEEFKTDKWYTQ